jgi:CRISPR-associated endoribonuclease Cas6
MRFKLSLQKIGIGNNIPINYQYELSAWIYKTIHFGNPDFSKWLHSVGYSDGRKTFKLFTFSGIQVFPYKINGDRLIIQAPQASITISFYLDEAAEPFIIGLFRQQTFSIGDRKSHTDFTISTVERLPDIELISTMRFKALSPIVISTLDPVISDNAQYLDPQHVNYHQLFFRNLLAKYNAASNHAQTLHETQLGKCLLKILNTPRSKLVVIKANTAQETKVRGFTFDFEITAPAELIEIGYKAGFGEKNSIGFGFVMYKTKT